MKIDNTVNVKYTLGVGRYDMDDLTKKVMEAEQKLFDTCPKMRDPDWWENGSELTAEQEEKMDKKAQEWANEMKKKLSIT